MKRVLILLFILMALAQWIVPGQMLLKYYNVLQRGHSFKFKTAPVDPVDYFKGRYVSLSFEETSLPVDSSFTLGRGEPVFITITANAAGYAHISGYSINEPGKEKDFIKAAVSYIGYDDSTHTNVLHIDYPFQKYYMEETRAQVVEQQYRSSRRKPGETYAIVNVYNGEGVIRNLFINDKKVE